MTEKEIRNGLTELERSFRGILHPEGLGVLDEAIAKTYGADPVGYVINPTRPLAFEARTNDELGIEVWTDLYCDIRWDDDILPIAQDLTIRVWSRWSTGGEISAGQQFMRDCELEALRKAEAERSLTPRDHEVLAALDRARYGSDTRVVYRCHFDRAGTNPETGPQPGPRYHLQFGGEPRDEEAPWLERVISLPRLHTTPTDAILACDMIASNFYPDHHARLVKEPAWRSAVRQSERMLRAFYEESLRVMDRDGCATHHWDHRRLTEAEAAREAQDGR